MERVAVDHQRVRGGERATQQRPCLVIAAEARADDQRADPRVVQRGVVEAAADQRMRGAGDGRAEQRDIAGAGVHRGGGGQMRGAGHPPLHDGDHAARELVAVGHGRRQRGGGQDVRGGGGLHADRHDAHRAAPRGARLEQMRGLHRAERERDVDGGHVAQQRPGVGGDAAGQVDRDR